MFRASLLAAILLAAALCAACGETSAYSRSFGPKSNLLTAQPTLRWEIWPAAGGKVTSQQMLVNGKAVPASYSVTDRAIVFTPSTPLPPGEYKVDCRVVIDGSLVANKSWTFTIARDATRSLPDAGEAQLRAVNEANRLRSLLGLPAMVTDARLCAASQEHAKYLARNNTTGHFQTPGTPGFFGNTPGERLEAYGFLDDSWECVNYGCDQPEESVWSLFDAPYHRIPFLQPGPIAVGSGFTSARLAMAFGSSKQSATVVSPAPDQQNVPTKWSANERPNPLRLHTGAKLPVGYVVVFSHWMPEGCQLDVKEAWLKNAQDGSTVDVYLNTPSNDDHLRNVCFLIPKKPLQPGATYRAFVSADAIPEQNGRRLNVKKEWQFTTAAR
jgi:uncharacterized protein YkwD